IQNKSMVRRLAPVRMPDGSDEALKECPFVVGHQIACQGHLPRRDDLESQPDAQGNPFCQHNLRESNSSSVIVTRWKSVIPAGGKIHETAQFTSLNPESNYTKVSALFKRKPLMTLAGTSAELSLECRVINTAQFLMSIRLRAVQVRLDYTLNKKRPVQGRAFR